ncbi:MULTISPECIES: CoA transferase [unclassified Lysinibacillus]|uniref:CoA transferase n=1 Tax=unclassified Lysinibacillus TaxID=2636778 RepID=UPI0038265F0D
MKQQTLKGCRILELSTTLATSFAAELLRQQGAYVEKVSLKQPFFCDSQKVLTSSVQTASEWDIVLTDDSMWRSACFPKAVTVFINFHSFQTGDERELQVKAGWLKENEQETSPSIAIGGFPASLLVAAHIAFLTVCQLLEGRRESTVVVHVASILASALHGRLFTKEEQEIVPMMLTPAVDGHLFIGAPSDEQWAFLTRWAQLDLPTCTTQFQRRLQKRDIEASLSKWSSSQLRQELMTLGQTFRLPFASVQSHQEVIQCPQHKSRGFIEQQRIIRSPWIMSKGLAANQPFSFTSFKELQIVDLTAMWAGPYCTRLFADLGATVLKIEAPHRPDGIRGKSGSTPFFEELNRDKKSVVLDLNVQEDKEILLSLIEDSHIVVNNFSPRVMGNFGLTDDVLQLHNASIIHASLSAFGQTGPYRDYVGYGSTLESMSGIVAQTLDHTGTPTLPPFSISDMLAGVMGAFSIALALYEQTTTHAAYMIDVSQYEVATMVAWVSYEPTSDALNVKTMHKCDDIIIEETPNSWQEEKGRAPYFGEHTAYYKTYYSKEKRDSL